MSLPLHQEARQRTLYDQMRRLAAIEDRLDIIVASRTWRWWLLKKEAPIGSSRTISSKRLQVPFSNNLYNLNTCAIA